MEGISYKGRLQILRFIHCAKIWSFLALSFASLEEFDLSYCDAPERFALMVNRYVGELKILRVLKCTKIRIIPSLMLLSPKEPDLSDCSGLESIQPVVDGFGYKLKTMNVRGCEDSTSQFGFTINT